MQYRKSTDAIGTFETYWFEKNLQGDIIAVYNEGGTKLVSYVYDAWGNVTVTYSNNGASTAAQYNPFRYRGYYYDSELGFYYLNSRYYDPETGRFISADEFVNANGDIIGFNMFAYCSNNPIMGYDPTGQGWFEDWWDDVCETVKETSVRVVDAFLMSIEVDFGFGFGFDIKIGENASMGNYHDLYLGLDDGYGVAGNVLSSEFEIGPISFGKTYDHNSERDGKRNVCKECGMNLTAKSMTQCSHSVVTKSYEDNGFGPFIFKSNGDLVFGVSKSQHFIIGGHYNAGINITEFIERVFSN